MRSHQTAVDGVVAHATRFRNAFRNNACERPPRPRLFRNGSVLLMARPLLRLRPVGLALRALLCKEGNAPAPESMAKIMLDASYNLRSEERRVGKEVKS